MKKNKQAMQLAQDVINYLESGQIATCHSTYFCSAYSVKLSKNMLIKTAMERTTCRVCADGALFTAAVLRYNGLKCRDLPQDDIWYDGFSISLGVLRKTLRKYFSEKQIQLIDIAYETGSGSFGSSSLVSENEYEKACDFGQAYTSSDERMIGIMQNIIANNGYFRPIMQKDF